MTAAEQIVAASIATSVTESVPSTIPEAIAVQSVVRGQALAVTAGCQALAYRELDLRAGALAAYLQSLGVGPEVPVGLCLPRSLDLVIAALAIWKAGGAYVPLDPAYPSERLEFMLDDAQAPIMITSVSLARNFRTDARRIVVDIAEFPGECAPSFTASWQPEQLAYIIYTSGSTGRPKGVEVTHANLSNLVAWHLHAFGISPRDRASHVAGLGFDAAVWELWPYLAAGASVHLANELTRTSAENLRDWLVAENISISFVPTPIAEQMLALEWPHDAPLRILLTGGDALHRYPPPGLPFKVINNYGPTECTVVATSSEVQPCESAEAPSIGRAMSGVQIHLLDEALRRVGDGQQGEIYIGGAGVARGYRNRPELTEEKFIRDPFSPDSRARLYRTGDLARFLPNGELAFLGRADDQIKIRGYRIEPGEIASALNRHPEVRGSLVQAREENGGEKCLVAYLVLAPSSTVTPSGLRDFLRRDLPEYMLPAVFVKLAALPLTANGKIDRLALPVPDAGNRLSDDSAESPRSQTEERVAEIVKELLNVDEIGPDDDFFLMGGHSLLGAQLIARIRDRLGVEIPLRRLFEEPTIAALAAEVGRAGAQKAA